MAKAPAKIASPDTRFRLQIETALAGGSSREEMVLHLTYRDANLLTRDPATPLADISFSDGVMRFLGVRVEKGGVPISALECSAPPA